jgi:hypothetical protein
MSIPIMNVLDDTMFVGRTLSEVFEKEYSNTYNRCFSVSGTPVFFFATLCASDIIVCLSLSQALKITTDLKFK